MKKIFAGILLVQAFFCLSGNAQTTDVLRTQLNSIFQYVDKSQVPTGYLEEYGPRIVPFDIFNGILTDSNRVDNDLWEVLYGSIRASKIYGSTSLPELPTVTSAIKTNSNYPAYTFAVPMLLIDYAALNENAVQQNLFTVTNNQIFDVQGRPQSPYLQRTLFAATPSLNYTGNGTVTVLFKSDLFYTNTNKTISNVQIDFNDHNGYITIQLNRPYTKTYTDTGYKRWKIKLNCTDNSSYECYAEFYVAEVAANNTIAGRYSLQPNIVEMSIPAVPGPSPGWHKGRKLSVWYSKTGAPGVLDKPFFIVEGYDASRVAPLFKKPLDYKELWGLLNEQPGSYDFMTNLDDLAGYDLVFLDFNDGTDDILRNVLVFQEALKWINQQKATAANPKQNVILGMSMGGLIIRYGLAEITKYGSPAMWPNGTDTRLVITHDSPHQGANTPLGSQYISQGFWQMG